MSEPKFSVKDNVYFKHPKFSWVISTVKTAGPNPAFNSKKSAAKKISPFIYTLDVADPDRDAKESDVKNVDEGLLETCDITLVNKTVDDLLNLSILHDATLLRCLFVRYMNDIVYTNIGAIVVALNPFNYKIPHYMDDQMKNYLAEAGKPISDRLLPHSWAQAHNTYEEMRSTSSTQCILISGESGAGKTEATKIVMKYLAKISAISAPPEDVAEASQVTVKLTACSPVLEAFGNAKTVRNDNSSRFGKLMKIKFDGNNVVRGAHTTKYLLEKSRIVTCSKNERIYHAFYLAVRGKDAKTLCRFDIAPTSYKSINSGGILDNKEFSTAEDYLEVRGAMEKLAIVGETLDSVWKIAAAVVHHCNVAFEPVGEGCQLDPASRPFFETTCALWGVDTEALLKEYRIQTLVIGGQQVERLQTLAKAFDSRDALSKAIYDALFTWLVEQCNLSCDTPVGDLWIALLDIFGFEDFEQNSFEQLCINLTNETLQGHYNSYVFARDLAQCKQEGIDVVDIVCPDNGPCLTMIGKLLKILDDQCGTGSGTDEKFLDSAISGYSKHEFFMTKPLLKNSFCIRHYAGDVTYNVLGWIEKNRDTLRDSVKAIMAQSSDALLAGLMGGSGAGGGKFTVGAYFTRQLSELMAVINGTNPHWIRCVKPHPAKKPRMFDGVSALAQLESSGVLGTVKIRKAGYPVRWPHDRFVKQYGIIIGVSSAALASGGRKATDDSANILKKVGCEKAMAQIGKTLVFMKSDAYILLEKRRGHALKAFAITLQRFGRGMRGRIKTFQLGKLLPVQRIGRGVLARGILFHRFCQKHMARLRELRRQKEEAARALAEFQRMQQEERIAVETHEGADRRASVIEYDKAVNVFAAAWIQGKRSLEESKRRAKMAAAKMREQQLQRKLEKEYWQRVAVASVPLCSEEASARQTWLDAEVELHEVILYAEWKMRLNISMRRTKLDLEAEERHARLQVAQEAAGVRTALQQTISRSRFGAEVLETLARERKGRAKRQATQLREEQKRIAAAKWLKPADAARRIDGVAELQRHAAGARPPHGVPNLAEVMARRLRSAPPGLMDPLAVEAAGSLFSETVPLASAEIGQVVYVPGLGYRATVVERLEKMGRAVYRVELPFVGISHWIEQDEMYATVMAGATLEDEPSDAAFDRSLAAKPRSPPERERSPPARRRRSVSPSASPSPRGVVRAASLSRQQRSPRDEKAPFTRSIERAAEVRSAPSRQESFFFEAWRSRLASLEGDP